MEKNIKQFNVIYPNMNNTTEPAQNTKNSYVAPINPNFNPLLSQSNKPTLAKSDQPNPNQKNNNFNNNAPLTIPQKSPIEPRNEGKNEQPATKEKPYFINYKTEKNAQNKPLEKPIEKKEAKTESEQPQKTTEEPKSGLNYFS